MILSRAAFGCSLFSPLHRCHECTEQKQHCSFLVLCRSPLDPGRSFFFNLFLFVELRCLNRPVHFCCGFVLFFLEKKLLFFLLLGDGCEQTNNKQQKKMNRCTTAIVAVYSSGDAMTAYLFISVFTCLLSYTLYSAVFFFFPVTCFSVYHHLLVEFGADFYSFTKTALACIVPLMGVFWAALYALFHSSAPPPFPSFFFSC